MADLIRSIAELTRQEASAIGLDAPQADALAERLVAALRERHGGCTEYVAATDVAQRNREVRRCFDGRNRDAVCARFGIGRRTLYRIRRKGR